MVTKIIVLRVRRRGSGTTFPGDAAPEVSMFSLRDQHILHGRDEDWRGNVFHHLRNWKTVTMTTQTQSVSEHIQWFSWLGNPPPRRRCSFNTGPNASFHIFCQVIKVRYIQNLFIQIPFIHSLVYFSADSSSSEFVASEMSKHTFDGERGGACHLSIIVPGLTSVDAGVLQRDVKQHQRVFLIFMEELARVAGGQSMRVFVPGDLRQRDAAHLYKEADHPAHRHSLWLQVADDVRRLRH